MDENEIIKSDNAPSDEEAAAIMACITYILGGKNFYVKKIRRLKDDTWVRHSRTANLNRNYTYNNF